MYSSEILSGVLDSVLYISLAIFGIGVLFKLSMWFFKSVGMADKKVSSGARFGSGIVGLLKTIFSPRLFSLIKVLIVDVAFQLRILKDKKDNLVWIMHILIFSGFVGLLIFHAFDNLDSDYQSTVNPYMTLRNVFGLMALVGLVLAIVRRASVMKDRITTTGMDVYAILIIAIILITGFLLEGIKITSYSDYTRMVEEYSDASDDEEALALESYWVENYSLVSPNAKGPASEEVLSQGQELHEMSCADCHVKPSAAFVSYGIAQVTKPAALSLDKIKDTVWYIHITACLFGLASLAFTKMFHVLSTPMSLIVAEVTKSEETAADVATRQAIELDGCSHGGLCREECPVRVKRQKRIEQMEPFSASFEYVEKKSGADLGNRNPVG